MASSVGQGRWAQAGFSILELVMVLVLVGIVGAVVVFRWPTGGDLYPMAHQLAMDLRMAQSMAMNRGGEYRVQAPCSCTPIPTSACHYEICDAAMARQATPGEVAFKVGAAAPFLLVFDGWGRPKNAVGTELTEDYTITLRDGTSTQTVVVVAKTGLVRVP